MTNDTCVKYSLAPQAYKIFSTHAHEISVCTIIYTLLQMRSPHIKGMNCDVQYDLDTLVFKHRKQLEVFHSIIL